MHVKSSSCLICSVYQLQTVTYLNVDVLFAGILNEESKSVPPHGVVGSIAGLQIEGKVLKKCFFDIRLTQTAVRYKSLTLTLLSLVVSCTEICTIGLGSLLPFLICNMPSTLMWVTARILNTSLQLTPGMLNLQADRALDPDRWPGWRQKEDQLSCWLSSGSSGSPGGREMKHEGHMIKI